MDSSSLSPSCIRLPERVFISYSRKDAEWLERLLAHFALLIDSGMVDLWYDAGEIEPGDVFNRSIEQAIDTSSAAVLLVSADFQASDFIKKNELPRLLRHADAGELRLFWLPVGHCPLADKLGTTYHTVGSPSQPLETCNRGEVNKVLADLARKLEYHVIDARQGANAARQAAEKADRERIAAEWAEKLQCEVVAARALAEEELRKAEEEAEGTERDVEMEETKAGKERELAPPYGADKPPSFSRYRPFVNSLGIEFVPVPGGRALFAKWPVRVQDYARFAADTPWVDDSWKDVKYNGHNQAPDHPVVCVNWEHAKAFCDWLSQEEGRTYRLPTDHEWSLAVGIGDREDPNVTPKEKNLRIRGAYPWGEGWPPPSGAGNYAGEEMRAINHLVVIQGYRDNHPFTSPVGSYAANGLGIHDLGGNVWEWCEDKFEPSFSQRVLRGGSWCSFWGRDQLLSSYRGADADDLSNLSLDYGFRVVVELGESP